MRGRRRRGAGPWVSLEPTPVPVDGAGQRPEQEEDEGEEAPHAAVALHHRGLRLADPVDRDDLLRGALELVPHGRLHRGASSNRAPRSVANLGLR